MKTNRKGLWLLAIPAMLGMLAFTFVKEETKETAFAKMYVPIWENAKAQTLAVAEAMPEDKYSYKPTDVSKTFAEQMMHISYASKTICDIFVMGEKKEFKEPSVEGMSKADIIKSLEENLSSVTESIASLSEEQLNEVVTTFTGNKMPKRQMIIFIQDHLTNHRAKANLYIRMNDLKPPKYAYY